MFSSARPVFVALAATLLIAACGTDDGAAGTGADTTVAGITVADTIPDTTPEATPDTTDAITEDTTASTEDTTASTEDTTASTEDTTASTDAPAQDVDADLAAAEAALLTLADLPEGWTDTPSAGDAASDLDALLAECVGVDSVTSSDASAASGTFASTDNSLVVTQRVGVQATEQDARLVIASLTNPDVPGCVAAAYTELGAAALSVGAVADGAEIGEVTASRLAVGAAGDATQAIRVVIPVTSSDTASQLTVDHVFARSGRSLATLTLEARADATAVETIDEVTAAAAARLPG
jgi:hypothetical protein